MGLVEGATERHLLQTIHQSEDLSPQPLVPAGDLAVQRVDHPPLHGLARSESFQQTSGSRRRLQRCEGSSRQRRRCTSNSSEHCGQGAAAVCQQRRRVGVQREPVGHGGRHQVQDRCLSPAAEHAVNFRNICAQHIPQLVHRRGLCAAVGGCEATALAGVGTGGVPQGAPGAVPGQLLPGIWATAPVLPAPITRSRRLSRRCGAEKDLCERLLQGW
mmetsp:Transcript_17948/g.52473  ORF Transcript_17948/g.52473 Transcript_17948/m.52473 type:complete len:216 (-) Transcript_17948:46-693(-)